MEKNKRMTAIIVAGVLLLTVIGVTVAYFAVSVINGTRQNLSATTVESVNLTLDDNDATSYSGQVSFGSTITRNLKLTNEGGPTKVALYFQDLINTYTAGAFTYTLSYATTENGSYTSVLTDVAIPRRSKASSTAKITEIEMPATSTRYYRIVITYNNLPEVNQTRDLTAHFTTGFTIKAVAQTIAEAHPNGDYMKDFCEADESDACQHIIDGQTLRVSRRAVLGNVNIQKENIVEILSHDSVTPPTGTIYSANGSPWDISEGENESVKAWLTNHIFSRYYVSQSECQTALNNGKVTNCEAGSFSAYTEYYDGSYDFTYTYETLNECLQYNDSANCRIYNFSYKGAYTVSDNYDLHIGQNGGVVVNSNAVKLFADYTNLESADLSNFDTSYVTNMKKMFYNLTKLTTLDLSSFNTSNVTDMSTMFASCSALTSLNIDNFDTANVTNMTSMFNGNSVLESLNLSNFDTANVTSLWGTFSYCNAITTFDLSNFDTSNVENMSYMFEGCTGVTSLDLSNFDTASVNTMEGMFSYVGNSSNRINTLDISNFDTDNVTRMVQMFYQSYITTVKFDKANFDALTYTNEPPFVYSSVTTVYLNTNAKNYYNSHWSSWPMTIIEV